MSKQKIYIGKTKDQFIDWLKNEYHYTPVPEPVDQFNFLYKKEGDTVWQEWEPTENDIQLVGEQITIKASDFKVMDGFADVREVKLPNRWNNGSEVVDVTSIGERVFYNCSSLTSVMIPNSITSIGDYAFRGCSSLTSMTIPDSVTSIGEAAFNRCSELTSITIPESVTSIKQEAFRYCSRLTSVTIPNSITNIGAWLFSDCSGLTGVTIGNSIKRIAGSAFQNCSGLTSVTIPDSVTNIDMYAFKNCTSLTSVAFNGNAPAVGNKPFDNVASGCKAVIDPAKEGWPANGEPWNNLTIEYKSV